MRCFELNFHARYPKNDDCSCHRTYRFATIIWVKRCTYGWGFQLSSNLDIASSAPDDELEMSCDLVKLLSGKLADAVANLPENYRMMSEPELVAAVQPNELDWKVRLTFWERVKEARLKGEPVTAVSIYQDIMSKPMFFSHYIVNPLRVAFMVRPVIEHTKLYEALARLAIQKLFKIIETAPIDPKFLPQILKLAESAGNRAWGPVVQKMQIQSKNVNIEVPGNAQGNALPAADEPAQIQAQIDQLQQKLLTRAKDVTPAEDPS